MKFTHVYRTLLYYPNLTRPPGVIHHFLPHDITVNDLWNTSLCVPVRAWLFPQLGLRQVANVMLLRL